MRKNIFLLALIPLLAADGFAQKKVEPFKAGDRVVFAGNSITEAGLYGSYIWLYYMTHFPERRLEVINGGVGGDVARQIYDRLDGDILPKKPTVLAITFGMNDSKYFEYLDKKNPVDEQKRQAIIKESFDSYVKIEDKLKKLPAVKTILMASSPYDETAKMEGNLFFGKAKTMLGIIDFQLSSAKKNNWGFVDFFNPMTEINIREQKNNPGYTNTGTDRIHPGSAGHFIMAYIFLKAQGLSNTPIADVKINATNKKVMATVNAKISNVKSAKGNISFDYLAKSLPYPIDTAARVWQNFQLQTEALAVIPFVKEFDQELLAVTGLTGQNYNLKIDGHVIRKFSASDLAAGINLATLKNTPQYQQALKILALNNDRRGVESKYRNYYWVQYDFLKDKGFLFNNSKEARDTIQNNLKKNGWLNAKKGDYDEIVDKEPEVRAKMDGLISQIYNINKPVVRHIELEEVL
jgi:lysophospholipase L1-like esterase